MMVQHCDACYAEIPKGESKTLPWYSQLGPTVEVCKECFGHVSPAIKAMDEERQDAESLIRKRFLERLAGTKPEEFFRGFMELREKGVI